jgi:hypothetical protein
VALQTFLRFGLSFISTPKGKNRPYAAACFQVFGRVAMTVGADGLHLEGRLCPPVRLNFRVADQLEIGADVFMAFGADAEFLHFLLGCRPGRREQTGAGDKDDGKGKPMKRELEQRSSGCR